ncbi:MAG: hypothetical protein J6P13_05730, partial [Kiritimatiellae bacterium]|nr:hypothetical protein [Kiritimatiellia bacterium]
MAKVNGAEARAVLKCADGWTEGREDDIISAVNNTTAFILALAVGASAPSPGGGISDFAPLSRKEAAEERAVCVTGVVTCVAYWQTNSCVIASVDDPNGFSIYVTGEHPIEEHTPVPGDSLTVGDILEVKGVT